jgi:hypothetical protein
MRRPYNRHNGKSSAQLAGHSFRALKSGVWQYHDKPILTDAGKPILAVAKTLPGVISKCTQGLIGGVLSVYNGNSSKTINPATKDGKRSTVTLCALDFLGHLSVKVCDIGSIREQVDEPKFSNRDFAAGES